MSFTGKLDDFGLPEVLQLLASNRKTGKLTLTRRDGHGLVVIRHGRIIYAATSSVREAIGNILLCRGLISETALIAAMERQNSDFGRTRLGAILVEMGELSQSDLEAVMRHQTGTVISELMAWEGGFFRFQDMVIPEGGEVEVDATDLLIQDGLKTEQVLLEALAQQPGPPGETHSTPSEVAGSQGPTPLRQIIEAEHAPALRGELSLKLMRTTGEVVRRGVLFAVRRNGVEVLAHFGLEGVAESELSSFRLSLESPSILADVVHWKSGHRGPLEQSTGNEHLLGLLGSDPRREVAVLPVVVGDSIAMVFYGDNHPARESVSDFRRLERAVAETGLAMEREALESKLRHLESRPLKAPEA